VSAGRRIFVGDIHGCREEFERLLELLRFDPAGDALYLVGDIVNRGPDSLGALRLVRALGGKPVIGNHDLHLLHVHAGTRRPGAGDTLDDVLAAADAGELCAWLAAQPFVRVLDDVYLIHAGVHPVWTDPREALAGSDPLAPDATALFATRVRYCDGAGREPGSDGGAPGPPFAPWFEHYHPSRHGGRTVVFGHWAAMGLVQRQHLRGLDTGCVWGHRLTAWIAEEDRLVHVQAARAYSRMTA
jgi:bis(5'-nucleosyl)-tetraphosphatase (symmetrical)